MRDFCVNLRAAALDQASDRAQWAVVPILDNACERTAAGIKRHSSQSLDQSHQYSAVRHTIKKHTLPQPRHRVPPDVRHFQSSRLQTRPGLQAVHNVVTPADGTDASQVNTVPSGPLQLFPSPRAHPNRRLLQRTGARHRESAGYWRPDGIRAARRRTRLALWAAPAQSSTSVAERKSNAKKTGQALKRRRAPRRGRRGSMYQEKICREGAGYLLPPFAAWLPTGHMCQVRESQGQGIKLGEGCSCNAHAIHIVQM